jgi:hypothetical protein
MEAHELVWRKGFGWEIPQGMFEPELVMYFGSREGLASGERYGELVQLFPRAHVVGCSTGGQIRGADILDDDIAAIAMRFAKTRTRVEIHSVTGADDSRRCGSAIGESLDADDLAGIFVLSDGLHVNGSELVAGINSGIRRGVPLTGGLAGDGARFQHTLVGADCAPQDYRVAAVGFYGSAIRIGHGSAGGWEVFGPRRRITRSEGNVLYTLDGEAALNLYERYLGEEEALRLPGSALLFPLHVYPPNQPERAVVRTVLSIDRSARSMTFAGDVPDGWTAQLMRGDLDRLTRGAAEAARQAVANVEHQGNGVAILVSCIGRRLLLGQRITDEIEAVAAELGPKLIPLGFYSYGEISPHSVSGVCELHNQTMTVTTISEAAA